MISQDDKIQDEANEDTIMNVRTNLKAGAAGMGDVVADFTRTTGLDRLAKGYEKLTGKPCGCEERRVRLNLLLPFNTSGAA